MLQALGNNDLQAALDALDAIAEGTAALEAIRPHLGNLCRLTRAMQGPRAAWGVPAALTAREREVLQWLTGGKTDRDIAAILGISPRTIHKHLQRIYEKLGVETRTAAVVRAMAMQ